MRTENWRVRSPDENRTLNFFAKRSWDPREPPGRLLPDRELVRVFVVRVPVRVLLARVPSARVEVPASFFPARRAPFPDDVGLRVSGPDDAPWRR
ncbi:hypothetical protein QP858_04830 [Trueperella bernardiae]|uniref:Uncharacterized protein n=1 Tax=Trueperella bernardiae TaxID=59561 RepID=A0AAW6ZLX9_9ACTO|nr:hypothetical protein [Trueperella bernardiae]MDK8601788.1 hypothetical protein [Trueperella bernardiae]